MWRDYVSEAIPIVADGTGKDDPKDPDVGPGEDDNDKPGQGDKPSEGNNPGKDDSNKGEGSVGATPDTDDNNNGDNASNGNDSSNAGKNADQESKQSMPATGDAGFVVLSILLTLLAAMAFTAASQCLHNRACVEHGAYTTHATAALGKHRRKASAIKRPTKCRMHR